MRRPQGRIPPGANLHRAKASQRICGAARIEDLDRELARGDAETLRRLLQGVPVACRFDIDRIAHVRSLGGAAGSGLDGQLAILSQIDQVLLERRK